MNHSPHTRPLPPLYPLLRTLALACALLVALMVALPAATALAATPAQDTPITATLIYQSAQPGSRGHAHA